MARKVCKLRRVKGKGKAAAKRRGKALAAFNKCRKEHGFKPKRHRRSRKSR